MTDFRALCAELADSVELLLEMRSNDRPMRVTEDRLSRARAALEAQPEPKTSRLRYCDVHGQQPENAWGCPECVREMRHQLAQPEPQGPSDEKLLRCYGLAKRDHCYEGPIDDWPKRAERAATVHGLRAVLTRWGRPAIEPVPEPQGPPKNCWLDDEPYLCPSPCVFDDPSEVIDNCLEARHLSEKNKPKEACKYYRTTAQPEPVVLTRPDCFNFAMDFLGGTEEVEVRNYIERLESAARAVLAQPEPQGPSELELEAIELKLWDKHRTKGYMGEEFMYDNDFSAALDEYRAALARWGRPAIGPVPGVEGADA